MQRIEKRVVAQCVTAVDTNFECAVRQGSSSAEHDIAVIDRTIIQGHLFGPIDMARYQLGGTRVTAAIAVAVR